MNGLVERKLTHTPEHFHFVSRKAWSRCARAWVITWWTQVTFYFHITVTWHAKNSTYYLPFSLFTISLRAKVNDGLQFFFSLLAKQVWNTWSFLSLPILNLCLWKHRTFLAINVIWLMTCQHGLADATTNTGSYCLLMILSWDTTDSTDIRLLHIYIKRL